MNFSNLKTHVLMICSAVLFPFRVEIVFWLYWIQHPLRVRKQRIWTRKDYIQLEEAMSILRKDRQYSSRSWRKSDSTYVCVVELVMRVWQRGSNMVSMYLKVSSHVQDSSEGGFLVNSNLTVGDPELSFIDSVFNFNRWTIASGKFPLVWAEQKL